MAIDGRTYNVPAVGGALALTKQPNEKFIVNLNFADWLGGVTTVASAGTPALNPTDATNAPTLTVGTVASPLVPVTIDAGTAIWNTTGTGKASILFTMANGEKKEVDFIITIVDY